MANEADITIILQQIKVGNADAQERLFERVYGELRRLAANRLRRERPNHTLQPTALVHEAYLRLLGKGKGNWENRNHFFCAAAHAMRHVLVDHARRFKAKKRGGGKVITEEGEVLAMVAPRAEEIIAVNEVLDRLGAHSQRLRTTVEMRFYAGFTDDEIAEILDVDPRTVKRDWKLARAWLEAEMKGSS